MKVGLGLFVWILFASMATGVFFTRRIRRDLNSESKPTRLETGKDLFSRSAYFRSEIYGALLGWVGGAVMIAAVVYLAVQRSVTR